MELPAEIEAFYVIPAVRRELARLLVARGLTQRAIAQKLGVTEPAVSQYLANKRGIPYEYPENVARELEAAADRIKAANDSSAARAEIAQLCDRIRDERVMCGIHRKHTTVKDGCSTCYE
jgi:predicted transcriptional regulator